MRPLFESEGVPLEEAAWQLLGPHVQERSKVLPDAVSMCRFAFEESIERDMSAMLKKKMTAELATSILESCVEALGAVEDFTPSVVETTLKEVVKALELKVGQVFVTVRIAATGAMATPPLFESLVAMGKDKTIERLKETVGILQSPEYAEAS